MLHYGFGTTSIGRIVVVFSAKGLCALRLVDGSTDEMIAKDLQRDFARFTLIRDDAAATDYVAQTQQVIAGQLASDKVKLDPQGTPFQKRVWKALVQVPWGRTCSYTELAAKAGNPKAVRAVASACARNPVAVIVPCHRILRNDGSLGGYFYGLDKKRELLAGEKC